MAVVHERRLEEAGSRASLLLLVPPSSLALDLADHPHAHLQDLANPELPRYEAQVTSGRRSSRKVEYQVRCLALSTSPVPLLSR